MSAHTQRPDLSELLHKNAALAMQNRDLQREITWIYNQQNALNTTVVDLIANTLELERWQDAMMVVATIAQRGYSLTIRMEDGGFWIEVTDQRGWGTIYFGPNLVEALLKIPC